MAADRRTTLAARARSQHGLVSLADLDRCGFNPAAVENELALGRLERVQAGTFRIAGVPVTWEQEVLGCVLAVGGDAVASHRSAARLWSLIDVGEDAIDLSVARHRGPSPRGASVHRSGDLAARWCTRRAGIPITNPLRTLVDLGAVAPRWQVSDALERALVARLVSIAAVERARHALGRPGRSGAGVLRRILDDRALGERPTDSLLEARMAALFATYGLPDPQVQYEIRAGGRLLGRVDFALPERMLVIEVDGFAVHGSAPALQQDLERQNRLVAAGWRVLRFTWHDVVRRPAAVAATIRLVLSEAA